jgi:hypothetical protein
MYNVSVILLVGTIVLTNAPPVQSTEFDPNLTSPATEPGWGRWQPKTMLDNAGFSAGFSNTELGGFLDFQSLCSQALGVSMDEAPYWFRLSNLVGQIGTGTAEFGCWQDGKLIASILNTAVNTQVGDVNCLRVRVPTGEDLRIRAEPGLESKIIGFVHNGKTLKPDSFPATIVQANGRNWVAIEAPKRGWISNDRPDSPGNLTFCQTMPRS